MKKTAIYLFLISFFLISFISPASYTFGQSNAPVFLQRNSDQAAPEQAAPKRAISQEKTRKRPPLTIDQRAQATPKPSPKEPCTKKRLESYLKAREILLAPTKVYTKDLDQYDQSSRNFAKLQKELKDHIQRSESLTKQPDFYETYSSLSNICQTQIEAYDVKKRR